VYWKRQFWTHINLESNNCQSKDRFELENTSG